MSACVMVVLSHRTKNASSAFGPISPPDFQRFSKKSSMGRRTAAQSAGPFGSNTAHRKPLLSECSMKIAKRRILTYF